MSTINEQIFLDHTREGTGIKMSITINADGVNVHPENDDLAFNGIFERGVFIEYYDGKLQAHIWDGTKEDPQTIVLLVNNGERT